MRDLLFYKPEYFPGFLQKKQNGCYYDRCRNGYGNNFDMFKMKITVVDYVYRTGQKHHHYNRQQGEHDDNHRKIYVRQDPFFC